MPSMPNEAFSIRDPREPSDSAILHASPRMSGMRAQYRAQYWHAESIRDEHRGGVTHDEVPSHVISVVTGFPM